MKLSPVCSSGRPFLISFVSFLLLAAAAFAEDGRIPPGGQRVDFTKSHGGDWKEGQCGQRRLQSPIDLTELYRPPLSTFNYYYASIPTLNMALMNDGRVLSLDLRGRSFGGVALPRAGAVWYKLVRIDMHALSEHTLRGKHAPLELQLVHEAPVEVPGEVPKIVTVSILVDSPTPVGIPKAPPQAQVSKLTGLLQRGTNGQRQPGMPQESADLADLDSDDDDVRADAGKVKTEGAAEIGFVHSLVVGEAEVTRIPEAGGANATEVEEYSAPMPGENGFNPTLQAFVRSEPPVYDQTTAVNVTSAQPLDLQGLLTGGSFFAYSGSETLPPCAERVTWIVKREKTLASAGQLKALLAKLFRLSDNAGNYRTTMPSNGRIVEVWSSELRKPADAPVAVLPPMGPPHGDPDGRENRWIPVAQDAITLSKAAQDYANDLDVRLSRAAVAHAKVLEEEDAPKPTPPPVFIPKDPRLEQVWAANEIAKAVKRAIANAVEADVRQVIPATGNLATSYVRQNILMRGGFRGPVLATPPPSDPATFGQPGSVAPPRPCEPPVCTKLL